MIKGMIEKIEKMTEPRIIEIDERTYSDKKIYPVLAPEPDALEVATLGSLIAYYNTNVDCLDKKDLIVHVESYNKVSMFSALKDPFQQRNIFIEAVAMTPTIHFERQMEVEPFIIQLQSMFVETPERDSLLKFLGSLTAGFSKTMSDNGVSQTVTAKTGAMVDNVEVPNPVTLQPYRTFSEIDQPESDFVFRIHGGTDITCALYEADGGAWKLTAIERIAEFLKKELPVVAVIA
jgi:hypothetical protein